MSEAGRCASRNERLAGSTWSAAVHLGNCLNIGYRERGIAGASGFEKSAPRGDMRATTQEGPTLALGHSAPHAKFDAIIERIGKALSANRAPNADGLGPILSRTLNEQRIRVGGATCGST